MKSWDSNSVHSHFALIIKAQSVWLQILLRKDEQNIFAFLNTTSVKRWSLRKSSYTTFPPICSLQISSQRTLENRNSKREETLSDFQDSKRCKMNIKEECWESWYFLFGSSYPDTRFQSDFHMISIYAIYIMKVQTLIYDVVMTSWVQTLISYLWHNSCTI